MRRLSVYVRIPSHTGRGCVNLTPLLWGGASGHCLGMSVAGSPATANQPTCHHGSSPVRIDDSLNARMRFFFLLVMVVGGCCEF
jgi:hypothetical protein